MTTISLLAPGRPVKATALVIATRKDGTNAVGVAGADVADALVNGRLAQALTALGATGRSDEVAKIPVLGSTDIDLIVAVGLGEQPGDGLDAEAVRRAVGGAIRSLAGSASAVVSIGAPDDVATVAAVAEGAALGAYTFTDYKSRDVTPAVGRVQIRAGATAANRAVLKRAAAVSLAMATVRDWVNISPADLYPQTMADRAATLARAAGCAVEVLDERALRRGHYGGILGVGSGSARPPRLVRVTYRAARPKVRVALVGKGITYDSGGYSLKVPQSGSMKGDMAGAATVLATAVLAAQLGLPIEVTATAALAENLVSGTGYRVGDVLTMHNGTTVEVNNTDAEGRLVLADAIARAAEDKPDYLIETSTLTGAASVALGNRIAGVMGSDQLCADVVAAGGSVGETLWAMPLPAELRPGLDSPVADLRNVTGNRHGGMLVGGLFLSEFVPDGLPWAHIDIAGPSWNDGRAYGYTPTGGTAYGVRTILATLERLIAR